MRIIGGVAVLAVGAVSVAAAGASPNAASRPAGVDQTCELALTRTDPATVNAAYPDEGAIYYIGHYQAVPGTHLRITGQYPHSRYMSFNVYDAAARPIDARADVQIAPDAGNRNPFPPGASRTVAKRNYTAFVDYSAIPSKRARNTLYSGTGQTGLPNYAGLFIYRIYVPDAGRGLTGGVPLPTVTLEQDSTNGRPAPSICATFNKPTVDGINDKVAGSNGLPVVPPAEVNGTPTPTWHKFENLPVALADLTLENPYADPARKTADQLPLQKLGGNGGFLSNIHNAYLYTGINRSYGNVLVTRMKVPTFPDTRPGPKSMPTGQVRYWSMCQNEPASQRYIACSTDDQTAVGRDGYATYVVSTPADRPSNATAACGVTWIPWGPTPEGNLIYRHMLADPAFGQAIQRIPNRAAEKSTMGSYFPQSRYYPTKRAFQQLGCGGATGRALTG